LDHLTTDQQICVYLDRRGISYVRFDHPPVFTCEAAARLVPPEAKGIQTKNLFLRDKRGRRHWLVVTSCEKAVDIKALGTQLDAGRLSFGSAERLMRCLGVTPGSVTLLALAHEGARDVEVVIDADIWMGDPLRCHPMTNAATLVLEKAQVERFLAATGHRPSILTLEAAAPESPRA
jgi:Ala-tRNA(Pro) deacylase